MSSPAPEFPPVDPTTFDLILIGTNLPASILAAAASTAGKTVLHLDPSPFYGSHFSSLSLSPSPPSISSFLLSSPSPTTPSHPLSSEYDVVPLSTRSLYSDVNIEASSPDVLETSRNFSLDVAGPRVLFCADSAIDLTLKSGVSNYLEFKCVDLSLIYDYDRESKSGRFSSVPDSRAAIFKDKGLGLMEKTHLMKFFKDVEDHLKNGEGVISEKDLERPFFEFLDKKKLSVKIKSIILYAIALADYDQENIETCKDLLKVKDGIKRLALYLSSLGRFNAQSAMLYPMYGHGELPQAFCRRAAVKGSIYVLRMPVAALLAEKGSGLYKGVRLNTGQDLFSSQLVIDPNFVVPRTLALSSGDAQESSQNPSSQAIKRKVARGICITRTSLKPDASKDASNLLIVFPPRSLCPEQATSVRALQLSGNVAVCPLGMFVLHLSALCDDASQGKELLKTAINALFRRPPGSSGSSPLESPEDTSVLESENIEEQNSTLLWTALYIQEITEGSVGTISTSPSPDGNLSYNDLIDATEKMFHQMYPGEEFFPDGDGDSDGDGDGDGGDADGDGDGVDPEY